MKIMDVTKTLIDKAAEKLGSQKAIAEKLGVDQNRVSQWKNGHAPIQPDDLAAIAYLAGYNAMNVLAAATIQNAAGTPKGELLDEALGKLSADSERHKKGASVRLIQWGITYINNIRSPRDWFRMHDKPVFPTVQTSNHDPTTRGKK